MQFAFVFPMPLPPSKGRCFPFLDATDRQRPASRHQSNPANSLAPTNQRQSVRDPRAVFVSLVPYCSTNVGCADADTVPNRTAIGRNAVKRLRDFVMVHLQSKISLAHPKANVSLRPQKILPFFVKRSNSPGSREPLGGHFWPRGRPWGFRLIPPRCP